VGIHIGLRRNLEITEWEWNEFDDLYAVSRISAQRCLFWVALILFPIYGILWAGMGIFKSKSQKDTTCVLSKLLYRFQPNFTQW